MAFIQDFRVHFEELPKKQEKKMPQLRLRTEGQVIVTQLDPNQPCQVRLSIAETEGERPLLEREWARLKAGQNPLYFPVEDQVKALGEKHGLELRLEARTPTRGIPARWVVSVQGYAGNVAVARTKERALELAREYLEGR